MQPQTDTPRMPVVYTDRPTLSIHIRKFLQSPLLRRLLVTLDLIADLEVLPASKGNTALGVFAHGLDVLLLVLDVVDDACFALVGVRARWINGLVDLPS